MQMELLINFIFSKQCMANIAQIKCRLLNLILMCMLSLRWKDAFKKISQASIHSDKPESSSYEVVLDTTRSPSTSQLSWMEPKDPKLLAKAVRQ